MFPLSTPTIDTGPFVAKCTTVSESGIAVPASSTSVAVR
jgi:hypothetical protein